MRIRILNRKVTVIELPLREVTPMILGNSGLLAIAFEEKRALVFCTSSVCKALTKLGSGSDGWKAITIEGIPSIHDYPGLLARALEPLKRLGISVLVISSLSKDYIFFSESRTKIKPSQVLAEVQKEFKRGPA